MQIAAENTEKYIAEIPQERRAAFTKLVETIRKNIPHGFTEMMQYSMPSWSVSLKDYPPGYHCAADTPLPFLSVANQKNSVNLYHMGIYANTALHDWFIEEFPKHSSRKPDMGKSCIRFKKPDDIPFDLIAELVQKITPEDWVELYESQMKRDKK